MIRFWKPPIPWLLVSAIDRLAWILGFHTYCGAFGGPGFHRGRIGADSIHFVRRLPGEARYKKLKPAKA